MPTTQPKPPEFVDAIDRRHRDKSQPIGAGYELTDGVLRVLRALRDGPLPTPILFEHYRGTEPSSYKYFQGVMTRVFHEKTHGGPFVYRPAALNPEPPTREPAWYALTPAGEVLFKKETRYSAPKTDPLKHRAMGSCIAASFELLAPNYGIDYFDAEDIYAHEKCPKQTLTLANPLLLQTPAGKLEPDGLMGFKYAEGFSFFVREEDRGTESVEREDMSQTALKEKFEKYACVFGSKLYRQQWGLPNLRVLFTTTRPGRITTILKLLDGKPYADKFLFEALPNFGVKWSSPRAPLAEVFEPWITVNGLKDISQS